MERGGKMRATVVSDTKRDTLQAGIRENVEPGKSSTPTPTVATPA
jgi:D-lyxose ketol-isomerase